MGAESDHGRRRRLNLWDGELRSLVFDAVVAACVASLYVVDAGRTAPVAFRWVAGGAVAVGLLVRRRLPIVAAVIQVLAGFSAPAVPSSMIVVYTAASRHNRAVIVTVASLIAAGLAVTSAERAARPLDLTAVLLLGAMVLTPLAAGLWIAARRRLLATLRDRADQAERERGLLAERAVSAERRRIAREMHDVVAHRISTIALQAGALSVTSAAERVIPVAELIRKASTTALSELRDVLRALREDGEPAESVTPAPTLASLGELVDDGIASGARIDLELPEPVPEVPGPVQRAAYRLVQESLTNAAKHAPNAPVQVHLACGQDGLALRVRNSAGAGHSRVPGLGYGLLGMRERVRLAGGTLRTGSTEDGGFQVQAWFPLWREEVVEAV